MNQSLQANPLAHLLANQTPKGRPNPLANLTLKQHQAVPPKAELKLQARPRVKVLATPVAHPIRVVRANRRANPQVKAVVNLLAKVTPLARVNHLANLIAVQLVSLPATLIRMERGVVANLAVKPVAPLAASLVALITQVAVSIDAITRTIKMINQASLQAIPVAIQVANPVVIPVVIPALKRKRNMANTRVPKTILNPVASRVANPVASLAANPAASLVANPTLRPVTQVLVS